MDTKQVKYELRNLISGKSGASYDALIQTVTSHLRSGKRTSPMAEEKHQNKAQDTEKLIEFTKSNNRGYSRRAIYRAAQSKKFMAANGFENRRRHDYENENLGLIIEDLHDENVLTAEGMLYL